MDILVTDTGDTLVTDIGDMLTTGAQMVETIRPDADSATGTWTNESSGSTLYASIDEVTASDSDYIQSAVDPSSDICKISLTNPTGNFSAGTLKFRYKKSGSGTINLRVRLLEGTTQLASFQYDGISATYTDGSEALSGLSISDPNNLFLEFKADFVSAVYEGPGDIATALAWWGLRAYSLAAIGHNIVDLVRDDAATLTVASVAGGGLDSAVVSWMSGHTAKVSKLYDQVGTQDMVQGTDAARPAFTLSGGLGSKPVIVFGGAQALSATLSLGATLNQPYTYSLVCKSDGPPVSNGIQNVIMVSNAGVTLAANLSDTANQFRWVTNSANQYVTVSDDVFHACQAIANSPNSYLYIDGTSNGPATTGTQGISAAGAIRWGANSADATDQPSNVSLTEGGLFEGDFSAVMADMDSNQTAYWGPF